MLRGLLCLPRSTYWQIFSYISNIPSTMALSPRHGLVCTAACNLIAASITLDALESQSREALPPWRKIIEFGLKSKDVPVQEAAAGAMSTISQLVDCSAVVQR